MDPTSTARCPRGYRCEACGTAVLPVAVVSVPTPAGPLCLTLCSACSSTRPETVLGCLGASTIERFVDQHAMHVASPLLRPSRQREKAY